jgi:hypothetical protein
MLEAQLERMRGMLFGYSSLFFATIRNWAFLSIGLLVLGWSGVLPAAVVPVPFIVPFAFLETGYLFWYTVFARRHAERLEQAINERLGRDVLVAHRLEAAYFYPPDAPKIAALSVGNPLGFMGAMTIGYSAGAGLLWLAGLLSTNAFIHATRSPGFPLSLAETIVVPLAIAGPSSSPGTSPGRSCAGPTRSASSRSCVTPIDCPCPSPRPRPSPS